MGYLCFLLLTQASFQEIMDTVVLKQIVMSEGNQKPDAAWWQPGMAIFLRLSSWIGGPIIIAVFVGKFLDRKFHTEPWLFLFSVGIAFIISTIMIVIIGVREMKNIEKESKK